MEYQWIFQVLVKGGRLYIITLVAVYTAYTRYILPSKGLYNPYYPLQELEKSIETTRWPGRFKDSTAGAYWCGLKIPIYSINQSNPIPIGSMYGIFTYISLWPFFRQMSTIWLITQIYSWNLLRSHSSSVSRETLELSKAYQSNRLL